MMQLCSPPVKHQQISSPHQLQVIIINIYKQFQHEQEVTDQTVAHTLVFSLLYFSGKS